MILLEADNRKLFQNSKYSFLNTNYSSGINTVYVLNATDTDFATDAFVLLGNIGSEEAEIMKISTVNSTTGQIVFTTTTKFAHSESTRVSVLPYTQIRFFHTTTTTFNLGSPLTGYIDVQPSDWFTVWSDETFSTGYGWYCFYNPVTAILSQPSNSIPYTGFDRDTVEDLLGDFFSLLNNKELKLVTRRDALSWMNEGYSIIRNKLNITNTEFTSSDLTSLSIIAGTYEYSLPDDFDHLVSFVSGLDQTNVGGSANFTKADIEFIPLREAFSYKGPTTRYYIRGTKIGILPTPTVNTTYNYIYNKRAAKVSINTDQIVLPNTGFYSIKDWMMYRAYMKFNNPLASSYYKSFTDNMNQMIVAAVKRDANLDKWSITRESNV